MYSVFVLCVTNRTWARPSVVQLGNGVATVWSTLAGPTRSLPVKVSFEEDAAVQFTNAVAFSAPPTQVQTRLLNASGRR